jgi:HD-GYP domain-containing protein (c-di-GMP phosphodiesterase class II)
MVWFPGTGRRLPLAARLAVMLTVGAFFVALLVAFIAGEHRQREQAAERDRGMVIFAEELAARSAPLVERGDLLRLSVLAAAGRDLARGRVLVLDALGRVLVDTALVLGDRQLGLLTSGGPFQRMVQFGDAMLLETVVPMQRSGAVVGELRVQHEARPLAASFQFGLFGMVFLCCLSLVAIAIVIGHHWLARVRRATNALIQLASGEATGGTHEIDAPAELHDLQQALQELERGTQEGLTRVADVFVQMALKLVESLERRGLTPPGHGDRTARYAGLLAARLGLLPQDRRDLEVACRLHDLGKAWVRPALLEKQEPLDEGELETLRQHPARAAAHLDAMPSLRRPSLVVRHQHERYGGSGHPDGLRGDRIPLGARILAIASAYDLLTVCAVGGGRPLDWSLALDRMAEDRGAVFDPWLLDLFAQEVRKSPPSREDRPVVISPAGVVALRNAVGPLDGDEDLVDDYDVAFSETLELVDESGEEGV